MRWAFTPYRSPTWTHLKRWILQGAPEQDIQPDVATSEPDPLVSHQDRQFWAFQSPRAHPLPSIQQRQQARNPTDLFVLEKLEEKGLTLSPEANRLTLIRRAYFDLTGLPPGPRKVQQFLSDPDPRAYEKLIDQLLSPPPLRRALGPALVGCGRLLRS